MRSFQSRKKRTDPVGLPCKKKMYDSLTEAEEAIAHLETTRWIKNLSAYRCTICGKWHLTSK
jgi:hypothetical protein